jgi:hypothetical protein
MKRLLPLCLRIQLSFHMSWKSSPRRIAGAIANYPAEVEEAFQAATSENALRTGKSKSAFSVTIFPASVSLSL